MDGMFESVRQHLQRTLRGFLRSEVCALADGAALWNCDPTATSARVTYRLVGPGDHGPPSRV